MRSCYIHIPFCENICSYCDFCKYFYQEKLVDQYLEDLEKEIDTYYQNDIVKTIYIGGGTPSSLSIKQLERLFQIIQKIKTIPHFEFTVECNIENLTQEKIELFYQMGVNRLSIGIQSFNTKNLTLLERNHTYTEVKEKIQTIRSVGFQNINVDFIYAIPGQTLNDLKEDLEKFLSLKVEHISTYSLMIEPHTKLYLKRLDPIAEELDYAMYTYIQKRLKEHHYEQYEISNFASSSKFSSHNLTYWNNEEYYGFGVGASGYIDRIRYENTKSLKKYHEKNFRFEEHLLSKEEELENTFILGLRKNKGISKKEFERKYHFQMQDLKIVRELLQEDKLRENEEYIYLNPDYIYISNSIFYRFLENCNIP